MISMMDITKRIRSLSTTPKRYRSNEILSEDNLDIQNPEKVMYYIENWQRLPRMNETENLEIALELFSFVCENYSVKHIHRGCRILTEAVETKVRDIKGAKELVSRKLGAGKGKLTKASNAVSKALKKMKSNFTAPKSDNKKTVKEAWNSIENTVDKIVHVDRIIENYDKFSKRFNIDKIIYENTRPNGIYDTAIMLCQLIDTYELPNIVKINSVLECAWYGFNKSGYNVEATDLFRPISDYFSTKENWYEDCRAIVESGILYDKEDLKGTDIEYLIEDEPEETEEEETMALTPDMEISEQMTKMSTARIINKLNEAKEDDEENKDKINFQKIVDDFKKSDDEHKEYKLKTLFTKLFTKNANDIVEETPTILNYVRSVFVLGSVIINPILGAVVALGDILVSLHLKRKEADIALKAFEKEIEKTNKKIESSTGEAKSRLEKYLNALEEAYAKMQIYSDDLRTDKELEDRYEEEINTANDIDSNSDSSNDRSDTGSKAGGGDDLDDFLLDDEDDGGFGEFSLDESFLTVIPRISSVIKEEYFSINDFLKNNIDKIPVDCYNEFVFFSKKLPDLVDGSILKESLSNYRDTIRKNSTIFETVAEKYHTIDTINECIRNLEKTNDVESFNVLDVYEAYDYLNAVNDICEAVRMISNSYRNRSPLTEASFINSLRAATEKVKKTFSKLTDKGKTAARAINSAVNKVTGSMKQNLQDEKREKIIKGTVIPNINKSLKVFLAAGALVLLKAPILALIAVLGYIGVNAKYSRKEKNMILDEIDIELKMCEKYIELAESNNDMKALKELLTIQKRLEREKQRILYNLKTKPKNFNKPNMPTSNTEE